MDVFEFQKFFVPLVLHTISEDERAFLHCTSSVMLQIPGFYRVRLPPPPTTQTVSIHQTNSRVLQ